ncbi:hypothetical protein ABWW58_04690 [Sporolactobacillus sp. STCC-11]
MSKEESEERIHDSKKRKSKADQFFTAPKKHGGCSTCGHVTWRPNQNK